MLCAYELNIRINFSKVSHVTESVEISIRMHLTYRYLTLQQSQDSGLRTQAEFIQHEYIQYCYSSGIHTYVNIG